MRQVIKYVYKRCKYHLKRQAGKIWGRGKNQVIEQSEALSKNTHGNFCLNFKFEDKDTSTPSIENKTREVCNRVFHNGNIFKLNAFLTNFVE